MRPGIAWRTPSTITRSSGFRPSADHQQLADLRTGFDAPALDDVLVVDDQEEFALLVETDRVSGNQKRVALLQRRHANSHEQTGEDRPVRVGKDTAQL